MPDSPHLGFMDIDAHALTAARDMLDAAGYSPPSLATRLATGAGLRLKAHDVARAMTMLRPDRPLDLLALVFLLGHDVDEAAAMVAVGSTGVETLVRAGLAQRSAGRLRPLLQLVPHDDLVIASDLPGPDAAGDVVPGVQAPSDLLARLTPRRHVQRALDVGTGTGIQALLLARHADEVVATDVNPRALRMTRLNAALNRVSGIEVRLGGLLDPVAGERFDLVVANPPYVISPEHGYQFRDAGGRGDELVRELVRGLPSVLTNSGVGIVLVSWVAGDGPPAPLDWVADPGCGRLLLVSRIESAADAAHIWNKDRASDQVAYEERIQRWLTFYQRQTIESIGYGALAVSAGVDPSTGWSAAIAAPLDGRGPAGPHVLRLLASHAALAAAGGRVSAVGPMVLAPDVELVERRRLGAGGLRTVGVEIRLAGGIGTAADLDAGGAVLAMAFDRPRTFDEAVGVARQALGLKRGEAEDASSSLVRSLLVNGFIALAER